MSENNRHNTNQLPSVNLRLELWYKKLQIDAILNPESACYVHFTGGVNNARNKKADIIKVSTTPAKIWDCSEQASICRT